MKRLMTIGLSCVLMAGCGEPAPDDEAPATAAQSLDEIEESLGDAPTTQAVEEATRAPCVRAAEIDGAQLGPVPSTVVVSCGVCGYSLKDRVLIYELLDLPAATPSELQMTLLSAPDPAGFTASFRGPRRGTLQFKEPLQNAAIFPASSRKMELQFCIGGQLHSASFTVD